MPEDESPQASPAPQSEKLGPQTEEPVPAPPRAQPHTPDLHPPEPPPYAPDMRLIEKVKRALPPRGKRSVKGKAPKRPGGSAER
jgi:hypothetical protein